ncbi:MAG: hypothetical protein AAGF48_09170 [Pseudomonadota bacterium]
MRELYPEVARWIRPDKWPQGGQHINDRQRSAFDFKVRTALAIADSMMELLMSSEFSQRVQLSTEELEELADRYAAEQIGVLYTASDGRSDTEYLARERRNRPRRKKKH